MNDDCTTIKADFEANIQKADSENALFQIKSKYLGRNSRLTAIIKSLKDLPPEERSTTGKAANALKNNLQQGVDDALESMRQVRKTRSISTSSQNAEAYCLHIQ